MMNVTKHLSEAQIQRYEQRLLAPVEFAAASAHLADCDSCYNRLNREAELDSAYRFLQAELSAAEQEQAAHPPFEEMSAYVDDKLNWADSEILESHLETCSACKDEVADLRILKSALATETLASDQPLASKRAARFGRTFDYRVAAKIVGVAAMILLLLWLGRWPLEKQIEQLRRRTEELQSQLSQAEANQEQLAQLRQENETLKHENESLRAQQASPQTPLVGDSHPSPGTPNSPTSDTPPVVSAGRVSLNQQDGLVGLDSLPRPYRQLLKAAWATEELPTPPVLHRLTGRAETLMGGASSSSFALASPVGTVIETDRPTFRWQPLAGAASYVVTVRDAKSKQVAASPSLQATEWTVPFSLARGGVYAWQVRAVKDGAEIVMPSAGSPEARFAILEQAKALRLQQAREIYRQSPLLLSALYADAGLIDEAGRELQTSLDAYPSSRVLQTLLRKLKARNH